MRRRGDELAASRMTVALVVAGLGERALAFRRTKAAPPVGSRSDTRPGVKMNVAPDERGIQRLAQEKIARRA